MILFAVLLAATDPAAPAPAAEKIQCRSKPVIGSLARTERECHSVAEWEALRRRTRDDLRRTTDGGFSAQKQ